MGISDLSYFSVWYRLSIALLSRVSKAQRIVYKCSAVAEPSHGGMQSSILLCLTQARINLEGCGRKGIRRENGGMMEVTH